MKQLITKGNAPARQLAHARIFLKIDQHAPGPRWTDEHVAEAFEMSRYTVIRIRERFVNHGLDDALTHRPHSQPGARAFDGEQEAHLIALSCSRVLSDKPGFPLGLLAGRLVELGYAEHVSHETVRQVLKKTRLLPWLKPCWCIPPEASAACVWRMEDVLEVSTRPYDPRFPPICRDESAKPLLRDKRESLPVQPGSLSALMTRLKPKGCASCFWRVSH